jgi:hypothetical protein
MVIGSWIGEEKPFPLKKRRSSFTRTLLNNIETTREQGKRRKVRVGSQTGRNGGVGNGLLRVLLCANITWIRQG